MKIRSLAEMVKNYRVSVGRGGSAGNGRHDNAAPLCIDIEKDPPITDAAAKSLAPSFEFPHIAEEGILFHRVNGKADTGLLSGRNAFKRSLCGPGEDDEPWLLLRGGHRGSRNHRARTQLCRDE